MVWGPSSNFEIRSLRNSAISECANVLMIYAELLGTDLKNVNDQVDLASELKLI